MNFVNEKSTYILTLNFTDEKGDPVTPTLASYRIDDQASGTEIKDDTLFYPDAPNYDIEITPTENRMLSEEASEVRIVTVIFQYAGDRQGTAEYLYAVKNLSKVV